MAHVRLDLAYSIPCTLFNLVNMKNPLLLSFVILITLTLCTGLLSYFELISVSYLPLVLMGIAFTKFYLVAYQFMELKKAHTFWKVATLIIGFGLAAGIAFFAIQ